MGGRILTKDHASGTPCSGDGAGADDGSASQVTPRPRGERFLQEDFKPTVVMEMKEMNHFCLNVLQSIPLPDFLEFVLSRLPWVLAVAWNHVEVVDPQD